MMIATMLWKGYKSAVQIDHALTLSPIARLNDFSDHTWNRFYDDLKNKQTYGTKFACVSIFRECELR